LSPLASGRKAAEAMRQERGGGGHRRFLCSEGAAYITGQNIRVDAVRLKAPDVAGVYVLSIEAGGMREPSPEHDFEVAP
jgi:hypothetical protein